MSNNDEFINEQPQGEPESFELMPIEPGHSKSIVQSGANNIEQHVEMLERQAQLMPRMLDAQNAILRACTYAEDWVIFDGQYELSSAGAERLLKHFPIKFSGVTCEKQEWQDKDGKAYRYITSGYAEMNDKQVYAEGTYSTRDRFLGKRNKQWRPIEDINENDIRAASRHIFVGQAIRTLLGIRRISEEQFIKMTQSAGLDPADTNKGHNFSNTKKNKEVKPGKGENSETKKKLYDLLARTIEGGDTVFFDSETGKNGLSRLPGKPDKDEFKTVAQEAIKELSTWVNNDGETIQGTDSILNMSEKQAAVCLGRLRSLVEDKNG